jgi:hypothetical protein
LVSLDEDDVPLSARAVDQLLDALAADADLVDETR